MSVIHDQANRRTQGVPRVAKTGEGFQMSFSLPAILAISCIFFFWLVSLRFSKRGREMLMHAFAISAAQIALPNNIREIPVCQVGATCADQSRSWWGCVRRRQRPSLVASFDCLIEHGTAVDMVNYK
eukprot:COSAG05_NODE_596_length_8452_cov_10.143302_2_plen_127_part_00